MAGIGFELRRLLRTQTYAGLLRAYGYAGIISSGPWVLSIVTVMALGALSLVQPRSAQPVAAFLVSVTYLVAVSMVATGAVQLLFTRFIADRLYEGNRAAVLPNLLGLLGVLDLVVGVGAALAAITLFGGTSATYRLEMFIGFVLLSDIWVVMIFLSGMRDYNSILVSFAAGYGTVLGLGLALHRHGLVGLLGAFCIGQAVLLFSMLWLVIRDHPSDRLVAWEFFDRDRTRRRLLGIGLLFNLAIWVDKFVFWYNPLTSVPIIGPLRMSPVYDLPLFLAYLSIVPGMAVFLVRMETDFVERYHAYYDAICSGDTLVHIEQLRAGMIDTARQGIYEIFKIQGITAAVLLVAAPTLMRTLGFSRLYVPLFDIDIIAVGVQLLLLAILNTLFYLDRLRIALWLSALFAAGNLLFSLWSQRLGVAFFGYGYALSAGIAALVGLAALSAVLDRLTYRTFMFQPGPASIEEQRGASGDYGVTLRPDHANIFDET